MTWSPPGGPARLVVAGAASAWVGAVAGLAGGWPAGGMLLVAVGAAVLGRRRPAVVVVAGLLLAGTVSGAFAAARESATLAAAVPSGVQVVGGRMLTDSRPAGGDHRFVLGPAWLGPGRVPWQGPALLVDAAAVPDAAAGELVEVLGQVTDRSGWWRGRPVGGRLRARRIEVQSAAGDPLFRVGNALRRRIQGGLAGDDPAAGLLAGFLIGDVAALPAGDVDALRRAGLTHFVAVSGSNVALFLAAWWLAAGPLAMGPRRRAVVGLAGLALFVVVTRWEPSVVRAATMAAIVLGGRAAGVVLDAWTALGAAVAVLVLVSATLVRDVGFQLSVAATAGVLAGAGMYGGRRPRWVWAALGATLAAQAAVAPLVLWHFGTVPLLAPLANVAAGPLVALATSAGGIGVVADIAPLVAAARVAARGVLIIARVAAEWPQLGAGASVAVGAAALLAMRRGWRPVLAVGAAVVVVVAVLPRPPPHAPVVTFLDVGQGDAVLVREPGGAVVLVDGGPDPARLLAALRRRGVRRIDLMVASHGHADHVTGLGAVAAALPVGRLWHPGHSEAGALLDELSAGLAARGVLVEAPAPGWSAAMGELRIEVLGPRRRYASPNDQSLVLRLSARGTTVLLPGDVEVVAQRELGPLPADVMKVPHQGAATSDLDWLRASAPEVAVISVGPNPFGHPSDEVIAVLQAAGATVRRTDQDGDVEMVLGESDG